MKLRISDELALPIGAVTEKLGFLGRTGSGKTYAAQKLAELMHAAGAQFVTLDPVGVWWALRLAKDGKGAGIELPVFGGLQGDVPLEPTAGKLIADVIVDRALTAIVDLSQFESDADKARFATDFGDRFFFRKKAAPSAVHLFIEEAQEIVPQNIQRGEERMLHAWTRMWKLGRNYGIGGSLISQRPQDINKKVLNQTELLFAFQLTGPQERKAVAGWIEEKGLDQDIAADLPKLKRGEPHAWSPAWLDISKVIRIAEKETFDGSSTPTVGKRAQVRELAPIDLEQLGESIKASRAKADAEDPKKLQARIRELEAQLKKGAPSAAAKTVERVVVDQKAIVRALDRQAAEISRRNADALRKARTLPKQIEAIRTELASMLDRTTVVLTVLETPVPVDPSPSENGNGVPAPMAAVAAPRAPAIRTAVRVTTPASIDGEEISGPQQRILNTLAAFEALGITEAQKHNVAVFSGASPTSSGYANNLGRLRMFELIDYPAGGMVALTDRGRGLARPDVAIASLDELHSAWLVKIPGPQGRILTRLIERYPKSIDRAELAELAEASATSSGYANNLGSLRSLGLIEYTRDRGVVATALLFPEGLS